MASDAKTTRSGWFSIWKEIPSRENNKKQMRATHAQ